MTIYSVFETQDKTTGLPEAVAVAEKFSWLAFLLPPVFFIRHGMLLGLLGFVAGVGVIAFGRMALGGEAAFYLYVLFALWIGFEAPQLRRLALRRHHRFGGDVVAAGADLAALEWFKRKAGQ